MHVCVVCVRACMCHDMTESFNTHTFTCTHNTSSSLSMSCLSNSILWFSELDLCGITGRWRGKERQQCFNYTHTHAESGSSTNLSLLTVGLLHPSPPPPPPPLLILSTERNIVFQPTIKPLLRCLKRLLKAKGETVTKLKSAFWFRYNQYAIVNNSNSYYSYNIHRMPDA